MHGGIDLGREGLEERLHLRITRPEEPLVMAIGVQGLAQGEEVLRPVVAHERLGDGLRGGLDPAVAVLGQHLRIPLPRQDRVEDGQARDPGDVADRVVELEIHLGEGLLHVLGVGGRQMNQGVAVPEQGADGADRLRRAEGPPQEADGMEVLEPLAVLDIRLPARDVLDVAGVHQADLNAAGLQDLVQGDPVDARGLHGDGGDAALREPRGHGEQILGEGPEAPDRLRVPVKRHADVELGGADVDRRRVRVQDRRGDGAGGASLTSGHGGLLRGGG